MVTPDHLRGERDSQDASHYSFEYSTKPAEQPAHFIKLVRHPENPMMMDTGAILSAAAAGNGVKTCSVSLIKKLTALKHSL